jgi:hypothetical protein
VIVSFSTQYRNSRRETSAQAAILLRMMMAVIMIVFSCSV